MSDRKTILFIPHFNNSFYEMLPVALLLKGEYGYRIHFAIEWVPYARIVEKCREYGFTYSLMGGAVNAEGDKTFREQKDQGVERSLYFMRRLKSLPVASELIRIAWQILFQSRMKRQAFHLLKKLNPSVVVTFRDDTPRISTFITHIANKNDISTILYPTQITLPETALALLYWKNGQTVSNLNPGQRLIYRMLLSLKVNLSFPWRGEDVLFMTPEAALIAYFNDIMPANPWIRGGGAARLTAVSNQSDYKRLVEKGIGADNLLLTGYPPIDDFCQGDTAKYRNALCNKLGIPSDRTVVCYASYPLLRGQEDMLHVSFDEFRDHERYLVEKFFEIDSNVHIVFKLHPRSRLDEYKFLSIGHHRLTIIRDIDINEVIAGCDLFSTYVSTTAFAALALRKTVITFGFQHDPTYEFFAKYLKGTYQARDRDEFKKAVYLALQEVRSNGTNRKKGVKDNLYGSVFDGSATARFSKVIHILASNRMSKLSVSLSQVVLAK